LGSLCHAGNGRAEGTRECICSVKCVTAVIYGDPHIISFDGARFTYHGTCELLALKPISQPMDIPTFSLHVVNQPETGRVNDVAYPKTAKLSLPDWGVTVTIQVKEMTLEVNGVPASPSYWYTRVDHHKVNFIRVNKVEDQESGKRQFFVTTSFGFGLLIEGKDLFVHMPRHPLLFGNTVGILGRWDDDASNDMTDSTGVKRLRNQITEFGNSYCVDQQGIMSADQYRAIDEQHRRKMEQCKSEKGSQMEKFCEGLLHVKIETGLCGHAQGNKMNAWDAAKAYDDCASDMCYAHEGGERDAACGVIQAYDVACGAHGVLTCY